MTAKTVLIVDDEAPIREMIAVALACLPICVTGGVIDVCLHAPNTGLSTC